MIYDTYLEIGEYSYERIVTESVRIHTRFLPWLFPFLMYCIFKCSGLQ
jgi:hypothetical protein